MVRDEEINRLIRYAQGMGLSVHFKPHHKGDGSSAEWHLDGSQITIYVKSRYSKIEKILSLIHEIAHHKAWIANDRENDPRVEEALDDEDAGKRNRKRILDMETADASHWEEIYRDTNCKFNIERLNRQKEFDLWHYVMYYEQNRFPINKEKTAKMKELRKKYGR